MQNFKELLKIAARSDIPVLILGESGVGKEVAARSLHEQSPRSAGPFIALNCGAIPSTLAESILEGAERGAFTGAVTSRPGVVRAAHGGTLFLDEIGELPLQSQARLLRILQEKKVLPVGAHQEVAVNFRLVCATHRNLQRLVQQGTFREDLFFRLNVFPVRVPPLRERLDEFASIANDLWERISQESTYCDNRKPLSNAEIQALEHFDWPGNIRQLKNVLERYHLLKDNNIKIHSLLSEESVQYNFEEMQKSRRKTPTIDILLETLKACHNNKARAAKKLGISRGCLCYQLKKAENEDRN